MGRRTWYGCRFGDYCELRSLAPRPLSPERLRGLLPGDKWGRLTGWCVVPRGKGSLLSPEHCRGGMRCSSFMRAGSWDLGGRAVLTDRVHRSRGDALSPPRCTSWEGFSIFPGMIRLGRRIGSSLYAQREAGEALGGTCLLQRPSVVREGKLRHLLRNYPSGGRRRLGGLESRTETRRYAPSPLWNYPSKGRKRRGGRRVKDRS